MVSQKNTVLVTNDIGYIGLHILIELDAVGLDLVIVGNLVSANETNPARIERVTSKPFPFYKMDTHDEDVLDEVLSRHHIDQMTRFAGLEAVGELVEKSLEYYENNISGTLAFLKAMHAHECTLIVLSFSVTVHGNPVLIPIIEECPRRIPMNPCGWTKWMIEQMLINIVRTGPKQNAALLRYFNPIGTHKSGLIGEDPNGVPNDLVPYIAQVAVGRLEALQVLGNDYDAPDSANVRDYIHVVDLAKGYVKVLGRMQGHNGSEVFDLGTGQGYSVLEVFYVFGGVCGRELSYAIRPRRVGDVATCYSDPKKAAEILGQKTKFGIERMCANLWCWQSTNPNGCASSDAASAAR